MCSSFFAPLRDRFQSWMLRQADPWMDWAYGERKRGLFVRLPATLLEIGPGAGANFRYYAAGTRVVGIEPNPSFFPRLRSQAARYHLTLDCRPGAGESLPLDAGSVSCVVATLVLCSVHEPSRVLSEIHRVLAPGGRYLFLEHVAADRGIAHWQQRAARRVWPALFHGCRVDQDTLPLIEAAGFDLVASERFQLARGWLPFSPHLVGTAVK